MFFSAFRKTVDKPDSSIMRSEESIAFEEAWEGARAGADIPDRSGIDLKRFARFARWLAIIEPDRNSSSLPLRLVGSGFFDFFKADLTGIDYLDLVDPAIKTLAYDSVIACLDQPCGLWQSTPAQTADGGTMPYEYTILPISKGTGRADHIIVYVNFEVVPMAPRPMVDRVEHAEIWHWLDTGFGVPGLVF